MVVRKKKKVSKWLECNVIGHMLEAVVALSKNDQFCMYLRMNCRTALEEWSLDGGCGGKDISVSGSHMCKYTKIQYTTI